MEADFKFYTEAYAAVSSLKHQLFPPPCRSRTYILHLKYFYLLACTLYIYILY